VFAVLARLAGPARHLLVDEPAEERDGVDRIDDRGRLPKKGRGGREQASEI
jgi:hypothetical protein